MSTSIELSPAQVISYVMGGDIKVWLDQNDIEYNLIWYNPECGILGIEFEKEDDAIEFKLTFFLDK